jgi:cytidine deaminase
MTAVKWSAPLVLNQLVALGRLPLEMQNVALAAVAAHRNSYAPYTNFQVGAALLHEDGTITSGCNYENCTLQACCAERCAIVRANAEGRRCANAIAVYGRGYTEAALTNPPPSDTLCTPCGLCRQLLAEVADLSQNFEDFIVICVAFDTTRAKLVRLADFLPGKFGPSDIGMDVAKLAKVVPFAAPQKLT